MFGNIFVGLEITRGFTMLLNFMRTPLLFDREHESCADSEPTDGHTCEEAESKVFLMIEVSVRETRTSEASYAAFMIFLLLIFGQGRD